MCYNIAEIRQRRKEKLDMRILLTANKMKELYAAAVTACGAEAIVKYLPDDDVDYDGLILCGGNDVSPCYYGEEVNGSVDMDGERDRTELALVKKFMETGKPIFGICRGMQLLNVALGGTLVQHLQNVEEHCIPALGDRRTHEVVAKKDSVWAKLYGERFAVNSYHHQAVKDVAADLEANLFSADGRVIEGYVHKTKPYLGVQWHPEGMLKNSGENMGEQVSETVDGIEIFRYFLQLCEQYKGK